MKPSWARAPRGKDLARPTTPTTIYSARFSSELGSILNPSQNSIPSPYQTIAHKTNRSHNPTYWTPDIELSPDCIVIRVKM